ncbi:MAG: GNAT family N-acetyltransferase [Gemmatimonas sp.]|jgi:ribosomal protein S18 acetylase RimI-like enzyme|uniref:GNAT family N-acetyltransferase n=1 Tax=Gemmatimonas sp. TaxID=1962908 RepID=UPI00391F698A|nr:GNAT family N-acetyltransferase [Gemmatimonadota bacterium]
MPDEPPIVTTRYATAADARALADLAARTFQDTFAADNDPAEMARHLASAYGEDQQGREIADATITTLLVDADGALAGYAQLRRGPPPAGVPREAPVELWRFYVDRAWHGRGVAQVLMQQVIEVARAAGAGTLWLGVWERNPRAQAFYRKSGFTDVGAHVFMLGTEAQTDRLFARPLVP